MNPSRRQFMRIAGAGALATSVDRGRAALAPARPRFRAVAFDAFPILDPRPIANLVEEFFPGNGAALTESWRTRQFEYTWLRSLSRRYVDFWQVTEEALIFAAAALGLSLEPSTRQRLMDAYLVLPAWPDVLPALTSLRAAGVQLAVLSNFTPRMLMAPLSNGRIDRLFAHVLSTDAVRTFKPHPLAYGLGVDAFGLPREEILFAPFAAWDAAGAKWFGYPTFWVNRLHAPFEQLGVAVDGSGSGLAELVQYVLALPG